MYRHGMFVSLSLAVLLTACSKTEPPSDPVRAVRTQVVAAQSGAANLELAAEIKPRTESRLAFRVGGKVVRRWVNVGDAVKAGQVLAQLDPEDLKLSQNVAQANLSAAQANLAQLAADYGRFKELREQGFISSAELERRDTALKAAQAQLAQAQAQASAQGNQAGYATLLADAHGVITAVDAEPGMVVAAGTPVLRLAHDGPRDVVFAVPEDMVTQLKAAAAQPAALLVRPWGGQATWPVTLRELAAAADPATRTFVAKADLGRGASAGSVRLGQTATLIVTLPRSTSSGYRLPLSALREERGQSAVWVLDAQAMTVALMPVQVSGVQGNEAIVSQGLQPGQEVVTAGVHALNPGQHVKRLFERKGPLATASSQAAAASASPERKP